MKLFNKNWKSVMTLGALIALQPAGIWADSSDSLRPFDQGPNDFRISRAGFTGLDGQGTNRGALNDAQMPASDYTGGNQFINVWRADDTIFSAVDNECEIYSIFSQQDGVLTGGLKRITNIGPAGDTDFIASAPDVAAADPLGGGASAQSYIVIFEATDQTKGIFDIFLHRLNGFGSPPFGQPAKRVSNMDDFVATDTSEIPPSDRAAKDPAIDYNPHDDQYLIVWSGRVNGKFDIYGQLVDNMGNEIGADDFRISTTALSGQVSTNLNFNAHKPRVVHSTNRNEYLVVWSQDTEGNADDQFDIWGRLIDNQGNFLGEPFRISSVGSNGDATCPDVAYNSNNGLSIDNQDPNNDEYLVVWSADPQLDEDFDIYGQRLDGLGNEIGADDFRISDMGPDTGSVQFPALDPAVEFNPVDDTYYVVWQGEDNTAPLVDGEQEIFGQLLDKLGNEIEADVRISDAGADGDTNAAAGRPAISVITRSAFTNSVTDVKFQILWDADDIGTSVPGFASLPVVDDEFEIHGQFVLGKQGLLKSSTSQLSLSNPDKKVCLTFKLTPPDANGEPNLIGPGSAGDGSNGLSLTYFLGFGFATTPETKFVPVPANPNLQDVFLPINSLFDPTTSASALTPLISGTNGAVGTLGEEFSIEIDFALLDPATLASFKGATISFALLAFQLDNIPGNPPSQEFIADPNATSNAVSVTIVD